MIVERAQRRDPDAWEALYRRTYGPLHSYARRRLPSSAHADDAVSETMTRAINRIDRFTWQGGGIDAWLYGILRNVVLEMGRAAGRARGSPSDDHPSSAGGPLDLVLHREEATHVRRAFARLSEEDQEVLELRVVGQLDAEAAGEVLGKKAGAVRMAQSRALGRLRTLLEEVSPQ